MRVRFWRALLRGLTISAGAALTVSVTAASLTVSLLLVAATIMDSSAVVPATAAVAVSVFLLREWLESGRKERQDKRKVSAIKHLMARECELNHFTIGRLTSALHALESGLTEKPPEKFHVLRVEGEDLFRVTDETGVLHAAWPLPPAHRRVLDQNLLEVAVLDSSLFATFESTADAVAEIDHVRRTLISMINSTLPEDEVHIDGLPEYGIRELEEARKIIAALYVECTGRPLTDFRLR